MDTILYLNASLTSEPYRLKLSGVRRYARTRGWNVHVIYFNTDMPSIGKLLADVRPVGVIVESCEDMPPVDRRFFKRIPVVYLDANSSRFSRRTPMIVHRSDEVIDIALNEFAALKRPHVAYVGWFDERFWSMAREHAFVRAASARGIPCTVFRSTRGVQKQIDYERDLMAWLAKQPEKLGVLAANDSIGSCVLSACKRLGLDVPNDIAVLGVDNDEVRCESESPRLSSIQMDVERAGYRAGELLDRLISRRQVECSCLTYGALSLIRRESTRAYPRTDARILKAVQLIREKACEGVRASDIASLIGGSRRHAEMRFREATGKSILEEIQEVRLEKVFFLLQRTGKPLEVIAASCGYRTADALRRVFLKRTGMSMRQWRKGMSSKQI